MLGEIGGPQEDGGAYGADLVDGEDRWGGQGRRRPDLTEPCARGVGGEGLAHLYMREGEWEGWK